MDRDKEEQVRRHLQGAKKFRSLAERKQLEQESRARKLERGDTSRTRRRFTPRDVDDLDAVDELDERETMGARRSDYASRQRFEPRLPSNELAAESEIAGSHGLVVGVAPGRVRVRLQGAGGAAIDARLAEEIARTQRSSVAVGDTCVVRELAQDVWRVEAVCERRSVLSRPDPARPDLERVVAANVDVAIVVASVASPSFRPRLVDRYLVALERGGIAALVCANKSDLLSSEDERELIGGILEEFRGFGAIAQFASTASGEGIDLLRDQVRGRTVVLVGQSGVGKSSLAHALFPELAPATAAVSERDGKGRHTTTSSQLYEVDDVGTRLIDTPGVRSFGLQDVTRANLASYFPDLVAHVGGCRFGDCTHVHEPACAVRDAVENGAFAKRRYDAYLRILASLDH